MITHTLQAPLSLARARNQFAPPAERCFLHHRPSVIEPLPTLSLRPPASAWPADADARASEFMHAFSRTGVLVSGEDMTLLLRRRTSQPISMLARWIVERRVVSFAWRGEYLVPMFQFEGVYMTVRRSVSAVLAELNGAFDDWDLATWFALPNSWLHDEAPVDVLPCDPHSVLQAARADRFIACG